MNLEKAFVIGNCMKRAIFKQQSNITERMALKGSSGLMIMTGMLVEWESLILM